MFLILNCTIPFVFLSEIHTDIYSDDRHRVSVFGSGDEGVGERLHFYETLSKGYIVCCKGTN